MATFINSAVEENPKRIGITLGTELTKRFVALAEFDKKKPATLAAEIVKAYMDTRAADIDSILNAKATYEKNVEELRRNSPPKF